MIQEIHAVRIRHERHMRKAEEERKWLDPKHMRRHEDREIKCSMHVKFSCKQQNKNMSVPERPGDFGNPVTKNHL